MIWWPDHEWPGSEIFTKCAEKIYEQLCQKQRRHFPAICEKPEGGVQTPPSPQRVNIYEWEQNHITLTMHSIDTHDVQTFGWSSIPVGCDCIKCSFSNLLDPSRTDWGSSTLYAETVLSFNWLLLQVQFVWPIFNELKVACVLSYELLPQSVDTKPCCCQCPHIHGQYTKTELVNVRLTWS